MPAILDHLFYGNGLENKNQSSNLLATADGIENDSNSTSTSTDSTEGIDNSKSNSTSTSTDSIEGIDDSNSTSTSTDSTEGIDNGNSTSIDYNGFHFLGALLPDDVACAVADGIMDPITMVFSIFI